MKRRVSWLGAVFGCVAGATAVAGPALGADRYEAEVASLAPRVYWRMSETDAGAKLTPHPSSTAFATVGGKVTATWSGETGLSRGARGLLGTDFDPCVGVDGTVSAGSLYDATSGYGGGITIEAWVKPGYLRNQTIITRSAGNPDTSWSNTIRILFVNGRYVFNAYAWDGAGKNVYGATPVELGKWYHVVATAKNNGELRLWVNGQLEPGVAQLRTMQWSGSDFARWFIASGVGGTQQGFTGGIDEVAVYSRVLTGEEIRRHWNLGSWGEFRDGAQDATQGQMTVSGTNRTFQWTRPAGAAPNSLEGVWDDAGTVEKVAAEYDAATHRLEFELTVSRTESAECYDLCTVRPALPEGLTVMVTDGDRPVPEGATSQARYAQFFVHAPPAPDPFSGPGPIASPLEVFACTWNGRQNRLRPFFFEDSFIDGKSAGDPWLPGDLTPATWSAPDRIVTNVAGGRGSASFDAAGTGVSDQYTTVVEPLDRPRIEGLPGSWRRVTVTGRRVFRFSLDASAVVGHTPLYKGDFPENAWHGTGFGDTIGLWVQIYESVRDDVEAPNAPSDTNAGWLSPGVDYFTLGELDENGLPITAESPALGFPEFRVGSLPYGSGQDVSGWETTGPSVLIPDTNRMGGFLLSSYRSLGQFIDVRCAADFDGVQGAQVADIFAFLRAWFAGDYAADFDGIDGVQVADIFAFLRAWFAGC